MGKIYSMKTATADDDLKFKLKRSIDLLERKKAMAKSKKAESKERATVSRERRLALALRALLDALDGQVQHEPIGEDVAKAGTDAKNELDALGFGALVGIPKRVAALNEQLTAAVTAGDGKEIARLGLELERAKAGLAPKEVAEKTKAATE